MSNSRFTLVAGDAACYTEGWLGFGRGDEKKDGSYKTYFSPCFYHSGVVYQSDDSGLEFAFNYRMACAREPFKPGFCAFDGDVPGSGYHNYLCQNQLKFFSENPLLKEFVDQFSNEIQVWFSNIGDLDEKLIEYAKLPHPKLKLRLRALENILSSGDFFHATFNRRVSGKMKKAELAKWRKISRLINDLTTEGSLMCGFVADQVKQCMASYTREHWFQFVKSPNLHDLKNVFDKMICPLEQVYFPFFSDDSCVAIRCVDGLFMANVDISSCDGSHTKAVFDLLRSTTSKDSRLHRFVDGAIKQCEMPLTLRSAGTQQKVLLKPNQPVLYSGSSLTTLINNFANIAIACAVKTQVTATTRMDECQELIRSAAEAAGYIVTIARCDTYHGIQFLKHSPCVARCGTLVPVLNLGVVLRSSGSCWGDLPTYSASHGKHLTFAERAFLYNVSQTQCYANSPTYDFLAAMRAKFHSSEKIMRPNSAYHFLVDRIEGDFSSYEIPSSEIALRYKLTTCDVDELCTTLDSGSMAHCPASRAILYLDYGFDSPEGSEATRFAEPSA